MVEGSACGSTARSSANVKKGRYMTSKEKNNRASEKDDGGRNITAR